MKKISCKVYPNTDIFQLSKKNVLDYPLNVFFLKQKL